MSCTRPLQAYRSVLHTTENKKSRIFFKLIDSNNHAYEEIELPCGQCLACRISKSREWALRIIHESCIWEHNSFITLTYNPENIDLSNRKCHNCDLYKRNGQRCPTGSLCKKDYQDFMKRLRKKFDGKQKDKNNKEPIRYFHCGEYGEQLKRPHHHAILFNFDFDDKVLFKNSTDKTCKLYISESLTKLWPHGFSTIGEVTWQSAAYVARYCTKKVTGDVAAVHYLAGHPDTETGECYYLEPEYLTMSNRPGIGYEWFEKYGIKQYEKDFITHNNLKFAIPTYYDKLYQRTQNDMSIIKEKRRQRACRHNPETLREHIKRNQAKEVILNQRFEKLMRSIEKNDTTNV